MYTRLFARVASLLVLTAAPQGCDREPVAPGQPPIQVSTFPGQLASVEWQEQARALVAANRLSALAAARVYAALSVAQHRAVRAADVELPSDGEPPLTTFGPGGRSRYEARRGAVAGASERVLAFLFPAAAGSLAQKFVEQANAGPGQVHPDFTNSALIGRTVADGMVAHLQNDNFTKPWSGTVPAGADKWIPTSLPPAGGTFGGVTPYYMTSGAQFRPAAPPALGSAAFAADLAEIVNMTQQRTPAELTLAKYWDFPAGTYTPIGFWNEAASSYASHYRLDERAATQMLSITHAAVMDALIGCWDAKYHYWLLRPSQASGDVSLAFAVPNFPAYPSGHSCASAAAGRALAHFFPDRASELATWVHEAGISRMLAGIHYRFDVTVGQQLGRQVAELAISHGAR